MASYPPSVNAIRQRLLTEQPELMRLPGGLVSALCRLAARPGLEESVAEATLWGQQLLGEPLVERLAPLTRLLLTEQYDLGKGQPILLTDPPASLLNFFQGVKQVWLCRGQSLTLRDGRRIGEELLAVGITPRPFGTTNRCLTKELTELAEEGDGVLWAASGSFRLGGFVQHYSPAELAGFAEQRNLSGAVYLDGWQESLPETCLPTFVSTPSEIGFAIGHTPKKQEQPDETLTRKLFDLLRENLFD
ncbi:hypothetical protein K8R78_06485 [bacterium]|nr:hypothetical protein [bacterium]